MIEIPKAEGPHDPPDCRAIMDIREWKPYQMPQPFLVKLAAAKEYRKIRSRTGD